MTEPLSREELNERVAEIIAEYWADAESETQDAALRRLAKALARTEDAALRRLAKALARTEAAAREPLPVEGTGLRALADEVVAAAQQFDADGGRRLRPALDAYEAAIREPACTCAGPTSDGGHRAFCAVTTFRAALAAADRSTVEAGRDGLNVERLARAIQFVETPVGGYFAPIQPFIDRAEVIATEYAALSPAAPEPEPSR